QGKAAVAGSAGQVATVLKADRRRSQIVSFMDLRRLGVKVNDAEDPEKALFKQATENGISVLVWGKLGVKEADVVLDGYVYDGGNDEVVAGKRYAGPSSVLRLMVHRLADEFVFRYTGEAGIARTKIAFVSEQTGSRELDGLDYEGYAT